MYVWDGYRPQFTAVDPDVNPLPACLDISRPSNYMNQFLPGGYSKRVQDPGFLTLAGEMIVIIDH